MEGWGWGGRRVLNAAIVLLSAAITVAMSTYYKQLRACFYDIDTGGYVLVVAGYSFLCSRFLSVVFILGLLKTVVLETFCAIAHTFILFTW